eukprot:TRINITY_DN9760_c0_g2_i1.p1 TRINITY_DN9760_c0_g2~~TRINITY_DN9760_c0_g2_i1.p1  ORF type:complete len:224 (-),score=79.60 TRINITY_DN9760_c0_g2_i1:150-821(-)
MKRDKSFSECEIVLKLLKESPLIQQLSKYLPLTTGEGLEQTEEKLRRHEYETGYQFAHDLRNLWTNYWLSTSNEELKALIRAAGNYFEELLRHPKHKKLLESTNDTYNTQTEHKSKAQNGGEKRAKRKVEEKPMSTKEKANLQRNIMQLSRKELSGLLPIIKETVDVGDKSSLEFDIEALPVDVCRRLEKYVNEISKTKPESTVLSNNLKKKAAKKKRRKVRR